mmetsp:Transcript_27850/g.41226  ORF Transcript_27850/g.41226 Transcript_27850/m.41226 type:complete len:214 (-) Transcript_27850:538-1179(-)
MPSSNSCCEEDASVKANVGVMVENNSASKSTSSSSSSWVFFPSSSLIKVAKWLIGSDSCSSWPSTMLVPLKALRRSEDASSITTSPSPETLLPFWFLEMMSLLLTVSAVNSWPDGISPRGKGSGSASISFLVISKTDKSRGICTVGFITISINLGFLRHSIKYFAFNCFLVLSPLKKTSIMLKSVPHCRIARKNFFVVSAFHLLALSLLTKLV